MASTTNTVASDVFGFANVAAVSVSVGASPFTYTNTTSGLQEVLLNGGSISTLQIVRNGTAQPMALGIGACLLGPSDSVTCLYLTAPTMLVLQII